MKTAKIELTYEEILALHEAVYVEMDAVYTVAESTPTEKKIIRKIYMKVQNAAKEIQDYYNAKS